MGQTVTTSSDKQDITIATWLNETSKGAMNDGTELEIDDAANNEAVTILSFTVGDLDTLGIDADTAILRKVYVVLTRRSSPSGSNGAQMCFLSTDFTENQANWYGPDDSSNTLEKWEPAFDGASTTGTPAMLKGQVIDSQSSSGAGAITFTIDQHLIDKQKIKFGSTINLGIWSTSGDAEFDHEGQTNKPQYYITYEIPTPEPPQISVIANPDGTTGTIKVDKLSSSPSLNKYSLCWSATDSVPKHDDDVTDFADTGLKEINTDELTTAPFADDDTTYYFRLYAEDGVNDDDNGGGSNVVKIIRPEVKPSGTAISPSSLTIGEETTLTVLSETISGHPYKGKFSSVLVNWDYAASDTAADYVEYKFADNTAPATTTVGNLTIKHKYHKNVDTSASANFGIKVKVRDPDGWVSEPHVVGNATVTSSNPIAHLNTNKGKVMNSTFVDKNNMLTISAAQSRAVGSNREIQNFLFTCHAGNADTIVTMGAYDNNNEVFDTGSKRVALRSLSDGTVGDTRLKVFGLASFDNANDPISDHNADFAYYKYTSELIKPPDAASTKVSLQGTTAGAADTVGNYSYNYFKSIDAAIFNTVDAQDVSGDRYVLTTYDGDWTTKLSGVSLTEDITINSEFMLGVDNVEVFKVGDVIKIGGEYMKVVNREVDNSRLYVYRGVESTSGSTHNFAYLGNGESSSVSKTAAHSDNDPISILDPYIINNDLRYRTKTDVTDWERRYRWGGYATVHGHATYPYTGLGAAAFDGSGNGVGNTILLTGAKGPGDTTNGSKGSSHSTGTTDLCWYRNGFYEDDIIAVTGTLQSGTAANGTASAPKYFKIAAIRDSSDDLSVYVYNELMLYGLDIDDYITTTLTTETFGGQIRRIVSNPTRTVAIYSPSTVTDEVVFETLVHDETTHSDRRVGYRNDTAFTTVTTTVPNVLDLLTTTDYDSDSTTNALTSTDIAILSANKSRSGGLSATMPLGADKYPVNVIRNKAGLPTMSVSLRILSSTGLRRIRSLIEGDTYDYVFIDSNQIDSPNTKEVTYRMKLSDGSLNKSPELANEYLADLEFVIVGEDVS